MRIAHVTLTTGHCADARREDVADAVLSQLDDWLQRAMRHPGPIELPGVAPYQAEAMQDNGALVVVIYAPQPEVGRPVPLIVCGIAAREDHGAYLWGLLSGSGQAVHPDAKRPAAPWLGTVLYPTLAQHPDVERWAADFAQCIAWAWVRRRPNLAAVPGGRADA